MSTEGEKWGDGTDYFGDPPEDDAKEEARIPENSDYLVIPVQLYDLLASAPMAPAPLILWCHYLRTARRQGTRSVWANNQYMAQGTGIGETNIRAAKTWMAAQGIIAYHRDRAAKGILGKVYTDLVGATSQPAASGCDHKPVSPPLVNPASGDHEPTGGSRSALNPILSSPLPVPRTKKKEKKPGAAAPALPPSRNGNGKRDAFWSRAADFTVTYGGHWATGGAEAKALDKLVAWAKLEEPDDYQAFLTKLLKGILLLKRGEVGGLSAKDREYWMVQPFTPRRILANAQSALSVLNRVAEQNKPLSEQQVALLTMGMK